MHFVFSLPFLEALRYFFNLPKKNQAQIATAKKSHVDEGMHHDDSHNIEIDHDDFQKKLKEIERMKLDET